MNQPYKTYTPTKKIFNSNINQNSNQNSNLNSNLNLNHSKVPFKPGFQSRGIINIKTNLFINLRNSKQEFKRLEESRIQKRLFKLIQLHFPFDSQSNLNPEIPNKSNHLNHLFNSLLDLSKNITQTSNSNSILIHPNQKIRLIEQSIVRWQDDNQVKECKICSTTFSLRLRKHHCRLCGSIICFNPNRLNRCSTLIRFEWDSNLKLNSIQNSFHHDQKIHGKIIQLTDQEIGLIDQSHSSLMDLLSTSNHPTNKIQPNNHKPIKSVRVCSDCLAIILRRQAMTFPPPIPRYMSIYSNLKRVQDQIESTLPEFQELITNSKNSNPNLNLKSEFNSSTPSQLITIRKKLFTNLTLFDSYSKELSAKFNPNHHSNNDLTNRQENESEIRLIKAITTRAGLFLRDNMSLIRSLGLLDLNTSTTPHPNKSNTKNFNKIKIQSINNHDENNQQDLNNLNNKNETNLKHHERNHSENFNFEEVDSSRNLELIKLNVLLEQEILIESYLVQARQKRQLEDVASLSTNLDDLREEISNLKKTLS